MATFARLGVGLGGVLALGVLMASPARAGAG